MNWWVTRGNNWNTVYYSCKTPFQFANVPPRKVQLSCVFDENPPPPPPPPPQSVNSNNSGAAVQESGGFELQPLNAEVGITGAAKVAQKHSGAVDADSLDDMLQPEVIATLGVLLLAIIILNCIL